MKGLLAATGRLANLELSFTIIRLGAEAQGVLNQMIHKTTRTRGRPRSFDEREALERAIQVFWSKGYDGVTIDDLVAGMGVGRPSLYSVFGDKRTLFLRVLKAYAERKGASALKALLSPQALPDALASFLRYIVESATEEGGATGCLLICVAPLVDDPEVRQLLQEAEAGAVAMVERRFREAIGAGEIQSDFPVAARATQVIDLVRGLTVRARMGTSRKTLLRDAEEAADLVLLPRGKGHGSDRARRARAVRG
jgi:AcrR family transcriptional regulator